MLDRVGDLGEKDARPPEPGDVTLCIRCGGAMVVTEGLGIRVPTQKEDKVFGRDPEIQRMRSMIHAMMHGRG
jgi:hypothetical protein